MPDKKLPPSNRDRFPTPEEMWYIWAGAERSHKMWLIVGPIHAAVTNWRAWCAIGAVVSFIYSERIIGLIEVYLGAP